MTVLEAIKIAEKHKYAPKLADITEYTDRFVMSYVGEDGEILDESPMYVMKETGEVGTFFPPDYDGDFLKSGIRRRVPKEYRS